VFANAVQEWDGTLSGFFKSLASGFKQMVQQILAELVRLMVIKAIMSIIGSAFGGGTSVGGGGGGMLGFAAQGYADGGIVKGDGTSRSDSIFARLSNGEFVMSAAAVKAFGQDFFHSLNRRTIPAFASGGFVGGSPAVGGPNTYSNSVNMTINTPDAQSFRESEGQIKARMLQELRQEQTRWNK
jgi:lambda family phage tail tape measure protein